MNKIDQIKKVIKEIVLHVKPTKDKESANKQIDCILVSTKMTKTKMILDDGIFCSGDNLDLIILNAFPKREEEFDYQIWLNSGYVGL